MKTGVGVAKEFVTEPVKLRLKREVVKLKQDTSQPIVSGEQVFSTTSSVRQDAIGTYSGWSNLSATRS